MKRRNYTKQFKIEAVRAMERGDTSPADLARCSGQVILAAVLEDFQ